MFLYLLLLKAADVCQTLFRIQVRFSLEAMTYFQNIALIQDKARIQFCQHTVLENSLHLRPNSETVSKLDVICD